MYSPHMRRHTPSPPYLVGPGDKVGFQRGVQFQQQVRGQGVILFKVRHQGQVQVCRVENRIAARVRPETEENKTPVLYFTHGNRYRCGKMEGPSPQTLQIYVYECLCIYSLSVSLFFYISGT